MKPRGAVAALAVLVASALVACGDAPDTSSAQSSNTAVLGGYGPPPSKSLAPTLTDARGNVIPPPPAPAATPVQMTLLEDEEALAVWIADRHVVAARFIRATGWTQPQALETIYGESTSPQVTSNGRGVAMAVWQHRVGNIHSLRFARFDPSGGWSLPDVLPGALPRPGGGPKDAPQLTMDDDGNVTARWTSGFHANEMQVARFVPGRGWTEAANEPIASAAPAASAAR